MIAFFAVYAIVKRVSSGIFAIDKKGIEFIAGFRRLSSPWDNIEKTGIYETEERGIKRSFIGIKFKNLDLFPENIKKILEINMTATGNHLTFYNDIFEKDLEEIFTHIKELQNTPEE